MAEAPLYYAQGLTVRSRPVETCNGDGTSSSTMGFMRDAYNEAMKPDA